MEFEVQTYMRKTKSVPMFFKEKQWEWREGTMSQRISRVIDNHISGVNNKPKAEVTRHVFRNLMR